MAEKIPFFEFFESFVPPRELRLLLHDACVTGGLLDRENRSMELELESGEEFPVLAVDVCDHTAVEFEFCNRFGCFEEASHCIVCDIRAVRQDLTYR